ncbi:protein hook homolog [Centruroides vittatus]|uniref:protein hook homolog n=1 Tax=Centruroides vittatus TaxID=120091 RepID=UPI003510AFA6
MVNMNCFSLLGILLVLQCRFLKAQSNDWQIEIRQINSKLADISNKITSIDRLTSKIDFIRLSLDLVNSKLDNSKRRIEETENNVKRISEICFGNEKEIENERSSSQKLIESNLSNKIDHYGNKMLKEQQNMKNSSGHQTLLLYEIQNITVLGLNKMLTKLETLLVSFNQQIHLFTGISSKAKDLLTKSIEHESQLIDLEEKLTENENWFKNSEENLKTRFLQLWSNISIVLNEKKGDLSQRALFRLTRTINQSEEIINLITEMGGLLEPKISTLRVYPR